LRAADPCPLVLSAERVYTSFRPTRYAEAVVAACGRVVYAGWLEEAVRVARLLGEALGCRPRSSRVEGVIVPGFVDAHLHLASLGFETGGVDLRGVDSLEELADLLRREARRFSDWVYGRGWDQDRLGGWPTRSLLDDAVPDKPVVLMRVCGHAAAVNTEALRRLGKPAAGDGLLFEEEAWEAYRAARRSLPAARLVLEAQRVLLENGVTAAATMGADAQELRGLVEAWRSGALRLRVRVYLDRVLLHALHDAGVAPGGLGDELLRVVGVKLFVDGSLGARTARLREPYSDDPGNRGRLLLDAAGVAREARLAKSLGLDVAVHAIGDEAVLEAVRGLQAAGARGRVEHASLTPPDVLEALAASGARVASQPRFILSDYWAPERLGERVRWLYAYRSMIARGIALGFSSDAPVEPVNPLEGVYAAVARPGPVGEATRGERLDVETALHLYTAGSAAVLGETRLGCLEPGCAADAAVLAEDPLSVAPEALPDIEFLGAVVAGEWAWRRGTG